MSGWPRVSRGDPGLEPRHTEAGRPGVRVQCPVGLRRQKDKAGESQAPAEGWPCPVVSESQARGLGQLRARVCSRWRSHRRPPRCCSTVMTVWGTPAPSCPQAIPVPSPLESLSLAQPDRCGFRSDDPLSPQWLRELKSRKRQSLYENQA